MSKRHFPYQHPTFGTKNKPRSPSYWQRSVYFWWFEYLKRSEGYKLTCKNQGNGEFAELYKDFGDVHASDFKAWWTDNDRCVRLFAEPRANYELVELQKPLSEEEISNPNLLYIQVPLNLPKRYLKKRFDEIISKHHQGKPGIRSARESKSKYPVIGQPNINALRLTLQVYDYRIANPTLTLWQIARNLKLFHLEQVNKASGAVWVEYDDKNVMAATVSRYLRKAKIMIENAGRGRFPDTKKPAK